MINFFNYHWAKPKENDEIDIELPLKLLQEMKKYHYDNETKEHAERKYDYDEVFVSLTNLIDDVRNAYTGCSFKGNVPVFTLKQRQAVKELTEKYLDACVRNKEFVFDHEPLKVSLGRRLIHLANNEGFVFDWHYWQLFHRDLKKDMLDEDNSLYEIEKIKKPFIIGVDNQNDDEEDEFSE